MDDAPGEWGDDADASDWVFDRQLKGEKGGRAEGRKGGKELGISN